MGLKSTQLWPESKRRISRRLFWWGIFVSGQHVSFRWKSWNIGTKEDGVFRKFGPHPKKKKFMGLKSCWPEAERTRWSLMFWGRTCCRRVPSQHQVIIRFKSYNVRTKKDGDSVKFEPHPKLQFSMGLKSTQSWPEPERSIASRMCWWDILRTRTASKLALQVAKHLNVRRRWRAP